jgi:hypothetical protein
MRINLYVSIILFMLSISLMLSKAVHAESTPVAQISNPLIGTWEWTNIKNSCNEIYIFAADGSSHITSGTETSTASYVIAEKPSDKGFYKVTLKIIKDHGGQDCSEEVTDNTGQEYTNFLVFHPSGNQYVVCEKETTDSCIGPLIRVH